MSDEIKPDKVRRGRTSRWKFTQTPQWTLLMAELSDAGYRIYSTLLAHVNVDDDDGEAWPQQETIGQMLTRRREAVSRVLTKELVPLGLVDVEVERYGTNNSRRRNIYTVHELPPEDFTGWANISEWYAAHPRPKPKATNRRERKNQSKSAGQPGRAKNRTSGDAEDRASGRAKKRTGMTPTPNETKGDSSSPQAPPSSDDAPAPEPTGREDESPTTDDQQGHTPVQEHTDHEGHLEHAQTLVDDAVKRWPRAHKAPGARDRHRLSERVAAELADDGDETVILHELTRDLKEAGSAVRVIMGARTTTPGWGRSTDPRPEHSRHEPRIQTPWCGQCNEHTRMVGIYNPTTGTTTPGRCRNEVRDRTGRSMACHPEATPHFQQETGDYEEMSPEQIQAAMEKSLEQAAETTRRGAARFREAFAEARAKADQN